MENCTDNDEFAKDKISLIDRSVEAAYEHDTLGTH